MTVFSISDDRLRDLAQDALNVARSLGASDASCEVSEATGLSVTVRKRKVETIEHTRDKGLGVTVYLGQRRGHASTSDFSKGAVRQAVEAAHNIARFTAEDDAAGLPDKDTLERSPRDVDLFHPWLLDADEAIRLAQHHEAKVRLIHVVDAFIVTPTLEAGRYIDDIQKSFRASGTRLLDKAAALVRRRGLEVDTVMFETVGGRAADVIVTQARKWRADIIVIGTHGRRGLGRLVMGSDAEQIIRSSPVPVLTVRAAK